MKRVAITGPESTGKTQLAAAIAHHLGTDFVPEYSRAYLLKHGLHYEPQDLDKISQGHSQAILDKTGELVLVDTDFVVMKVWSEYKYQQASPLINRLVSEDWFDLHILCAPDIPWEEDELRENPEDRDVLFKTYLEVLEKYRKEYIIVEGSHEKRLQKALVEIGRLQRNP